jgi:pimeloyl-ACP methyl ester carboxylesterase
VADEKFMERAKDMHLHETLYRVTVPLLITHGKHDPRSPLQQAQETAEQLVDSPRRKRMTCAARASGVQHSSFDNTASVGPDVDWVAEQLGERTIHS